MEMPNQPQIPVHKLTVGLTAGCETQALSVGGVDLAAITQALRLNYPSALSHLHAFLLFPHCTQGHRCGVSPATVL